MFMCPGRLQILKASQSRRNNCWPLSDGEQKDTQRGISGEDFIHQPIVSYGMLLAYVAGLESLVLSHYDQCKREQSDLDS